MNAVSFEEHAESEFLQTPLWTTSIQAEEIGDFDELMKLARRAYSSSYSGSGSFGYINPEDDQAIHEWSSLGGQLFSESNLYEQADGAERREMVKAWGEPVDWLYSWREVKDGLWSPQYLPERRFKADKMSRFVLSGMMGEQLLNDAELHECATEFETSRLGRAILVGGAALAAVSAPRGGRSYLGYTESDWTPQTWVGGDIIHNDFQSSRFLRVDSDVTTTLRPDRLHAFMPVHQISEVVGNHSIEAGIMEELLIHLVARGADPENIYNEITGQLQDDGILDEYVGSESYYRSSGLEQRLRYRIEDEISLVSNNAEGNGHVAVVSRNPILILKSSEEGIELSNPLMDEESHNKIALPDDEIVDYIVAMIQGNGRTPVGTMIRIVEGLVSPYPLRSPFDNAES